MRKSARVLRPAAARSHTLPPAPPSPPSGPPKGTNFSRRKLALPRPPWPAWTLMRASSTNRMGGAARAPRAPARAASRLLSGLGEVRQDAHVQSLLGALALEGDAARDLREERVIGTDPDVLACVYRRAALTHENVARQHPLAAETLDAETLGVRVAAVFGAAARLFVCHVR